MRDLPYLDIELPYMVSVIPCLDNEGKSARFVQHNNNKTERSGLLLALLLGLGELLVELSVPCFVDHSCLRT